MASPTFFTDGNTPSPTDTELERIYKVPMTEMLEARFRDSSGTIHAAAIPAPSLKELEWMIDDDLDKTNAPA